MFFWPILQNFTFTSQQNNQSTENTDVLIWRWSGLTCDSSYLSLEKSPHETSDMRPETDPNEVEGL